MPQGLSRTRLRLRTSSFMGSWASVRDCNAIRIVFSVPYMHISSIALAPSAFSKYTTFGARQYSTPSQGDAPNLIKQSGFLHLSSRALIAVEGRDAAGFLQGLTTANVPTTATAGGGHRPSAIYTTFLNAQGRILLDAFLYLVHPSSQTLGHSRDSAPPTNNDPVFLIETDQSQTDDLLKWLHRYKLRSKVSFRRISNLQTGVYFFWDDSNTPTPLLDPIRDVVSRGAYVADDTRSPNFGSRVLMSTDTAECLSSSTTTAEYTLRRYLRGLPEGPAELASGTALIHDSSLDKAGAVDFRKGCYVGQELVIRTQHTGVVRKRILPVILYPPNECPPITLGGGFRPISNVISTGTEIWRAAGTTSEEQAEYYGRKHRSLRSVGKWIAGVGNVGIGLLRLEPMAGLGPSGMKIEDWREPRFEISSKEAGTVRKWGIRAFLPRWWTERR